MSIMMVHKQIQRHRRELATRWERLVEAADAGMTTAEYAVGTLAAAAFAAVLIVIVRSDAVRSALTGIITTALGMGG